jgi:prepilin-type N-terminal cleavage/methylation domain-containing protein
MMIRRKQDGFTIVELLIVIVVIGILATLVITTFTGIQQKQRNSKRQAAVNATRAQLEAYFAQNNQYPTLADMNSSAWLTANMKGFDKTQLQDPKGTSETLVASPAVDVYAYAVTASDGTACDNQTKPCTQYTLTATYEGGGTYSKSNLN